MRTIGFVLWFMPHWIRIAVARRIGEAFKHSGSDATIWVVGDSAYWERAKFTVRRTA